jgi:hypothetical protein
MTAAALWPIAVRLTVIAVLERCWIGPSWTTFSLQRGSGVS